MTDTKMIEAAAVHRGTPVPAARPAPVAPEMTREQLAHQLREANELLYRWQWIDIDCLEEDEDTGETDLDTLLKDTHTHMQSQHPELSR